MYVYAYYCFSEYMLPKKLKYVLLLIVKQYIFIAKQHKISKKTKKINFQTF